MIAAMRDELADLLRRPGSDVSIFAYPPPVVVPPAVTIVPASPYVEGQYLNGAAGAVGLELQLITPALAARALDDLLWQVLTTLGGAGIHVGGVSSPSYSEPAGTLTVRISIILKWKV